MFPGTLVDVGPSAAKAVMAVISVAGKSAATPEAIIAYSPSDQNGRAVAFADGSVQVLSSEKFQEALARDAALPRVAVPANAPAAVQTLTAGVEMNTAPQPAAPPPQPRAEPAAPQEAFVNGAQPTAPAARPMREFSASVQTLGGGIGGGGGAAPQAKAMATGVRPIRIEVPRTGQAFTFT